MEPSQSEEVARRATRSTFWTRLFLVGAFIALLPKILVSFALRRLFGPRSDVPGDLQRSLVRGCVASPFLLFLAVFRL